MFILLSLMYEVERKRRSKAKEREKEMEISLPQNAFIWDFKFHTFISKMHLELK